MRWLCVLVLAFGCGDDDGTGGDDAGTRDAGMAEDAGAGDAGGEPVDAGPPGDGGLPPPPPSEPGLHDVEVMETTQLVPGDGLPAETDPQHSNNNLDVIRHTDGRVYLAWRTAPDHFAGPETIMYVVSSEDEETWEYETEVELGTDVREPGFLSFGDELIFYFTVLGTNRFTFEPMGVRAMTRSADGTWSEEAVDIGLPDRVAWRFREERGTAYVTSYLGGEHIYAFDGMPLNVELWSSEDGLDWTALAPEDAPEEPWVYEGGGSEMDFAIGDDGTLFAVIRKEGWDERGYGSEVCRAPAGDLAAFDCRTDPRKYDSPRMFWHDGEAYLIARRNVTETGHFDLMDEERPQMLTTIQYHARYSGEPKRCSLWRWVQEEHRIAWILDLPSTGDTCFPGLIEGEEEGEYVVYNYSADLEGIERNWSISQQGETYIYRHVLRFTRRE